jgi:hypothetical protein
MILTLEVIGNTVTCPLIFSHVHKSMNGDDREFLQWLIQFVPEHQNMKLHAIEIGKPAAVQFKKCPWEEGIQSSLVFDLEPALIDSTKKVAVEKVAIEPEVAKEENEEGPVSPDVQEIV